MQSAHGGNVEGKTDRSLLHRRHIHRYPEDVDSLAPLAADPKDAKGKDANWKIMERRLIAAFKRSLQDEVQSRNDIAEELVHVVPRRELVGKITELLAQRK